MKACWDKFYNNYSAMSIQKTCKHLLCGCKTTPLGACGAESQQDTSERVPHIMKTKTVSRKNCWLYLLSKYYFSCQVCNLTFKPKLVLNFDIWDTSKTISDNTIQYSDGKWLVWINNWGMHKCISQNNQSWNSSRKGKYIPEHNT